jgi:hypothetical protein
MIPSWLAHTTYCGRIDINRLPVQPVTAIIVRSDGATPWEVKAATARPGIGNIREALKSI